MTLSQPSAIGSSGRYSKVFRSSSSHSAGIYTPSPRDFIKSFDAVLSRWESETAFLSDPDAITGHPSYKALVANAEMVTPLIIAELKKQPSFLVWVLDDAFQIRPYSAEAVGDLEAMSKAWIAWAEQNGRSI